MKVTYDYNAKYNKTHKHSCLAIRQGRYRIELSGSVRRLPACISDCIQQRCSTDRATAADEAVAATISHDKRPSSCPLSRQRATSSVANVRRHGWFKDLDTVMRGAG